MAGEDRCRFPDLSQFTGPEELEKALSQYVEDQEDRLRIVAKLMWLLKRRENIDKKETDKGGKK